MYPAFARFLVFGGMGIKKFLVVRYQF